MNNDKRYGNNNSKKESLTFAILFGVIGMIWAFIEKQYLLGPNLSYIYVLITSVLIYLAAYEKIEKTQKINYKLRDSLKKISAVNEEKNKLEKRLRYLAYYDDLTGLPNKNLLRTYLNEKSLEKDRKFAILYLEVDDYKLTNESLGHEESELLLKKISNILDKSLKNEEYLARISENEFIIFIQDNVDKKELEDKSEKILNRILKPIQIESSTIHLSAKIGISIYPYISKSVEELLKDAHLAIHHIKYNPDNHYAFFNTEIGDRINKENYIIKELQKAIENKEFIPYFQPISYIENNQILGFETLIRWIHPEKGFISPAEFIPISEETGQIYDITDIILEKSLAQKQIWNNKGYRHFKISVNISSKSFEKENLELELKILELLGKYDIEPEELILEITETAAIKYDSIDDMHKIFNRFKGIGIEIALDDFGTGNSSLARLNALPIKYLKLDGAFVRNISQNKEEQAIVKAVIDLAKALDLVVIAEGIESIEQCETLLYIGCRIGQGYHLARPGPAEEIEKIFNIINL